MPTGTRIEEFVKNEDLLLRYHVRRDTHMHVAKACHKYSTKTVEIWSAEIYQHRDYPIFIEKAEPNGDKSTYAPSQKGHVSKFETRERLASMLRGQILVVRFPGGEKRIYVPNDLC